MLPSSNQSLIQHIQNKNTNIVCNDFVAISFCLKESIKIHQTIFLYLNFVSYNSFIHCQNKKKNNFQSRHFFTQFSFLYGIFCIIKTNDDHIVNLSIGHSQPIDPFKIHNFYVVLFDTNLILYLFVFHKLYFDSSVSSSSFEIFL